MYTIYSHDQRGYWTGKNYIHQGELFPCFEKEINKAKSWTSEKRAKSAFIKMQNWIYIYDLSIVKEEER